MITIRPVDVSIMALCSAERGVRDGKVSLSEFMVVIQGWMKEVFCLSLFRLNQSCAPMQPP